MKNKILLTFDVEEFDIPNEFGGSVSSDEQKRIGNTGLKIVHEILQRQKIPATLFCTVSQAKYSASLLREMADYCEIASHGMQHTGFNIKDLGESKSALETITGATVSGFRMPRLAGLNLQEIFNAGYSYDTSLNPTWLPGRYNDLDKPTMPFQEANLWRIPASVSTVFRIPLFWIGFKAFPEWLWRNLAEHTLRRKGLLCLYFHPWEFCDLSKYDLPKYAKHPSGDAYRVKFERFLHTFKSRADFITISDYLQTYRL